MKSSSNISKTKIKMFINKQSGGSYDMGEINFLYTD